MSTDNITEIKEKIINWLKEEACSPEEKPDPNTYFNILVKFGSLGCRVIQPVQRRDSISAAIKFPVPPEKIALLNGLSAEKKIEFFWDLRLALLKNNELADFQIEQDSHGDTKAVTIFSRPIFYEDLTKGRLMSAIFAVTRATLMVIWMIQKYAGKLPAKKGQKLPYST